MGLLPPQPTQVALAKSPQVWWCMLKNPTGHKYCRDGGWPCFHLNPPKLDRCSICAAKSKRGHTGVGWHGKQYVLGQYVALSTPIHVPSESRTEVSQSGLSCFNLNPPKLAASCIILSGLVHDAKHTRTQVLLGWDDLGM